MKRRNTLPLYTLALVCMASSGAVAQSAPPTHQADPDVYKVIFEDQNFRVIEAIRKMGVHDKTHGHPVPSVIYALNDCSTKIYDADGKTRVTNSKAGTAGPVPIIPSHSAENIGPTDCHSIFVERK